MAWPDVPYIDEHIETFWRYVHFTAAAADTIHREGGSVGETKTTIRRHIEQQFPSLFTEGGAATFHVGVGKALFCVFACFSERDTSVRVVTEREHKEERVSFARALRRRAEDSGDGMDRLRAVQDLAEAEATLAVHGRELSLVL